MEVLWYRRNFEVDGLQFPEVWARYGGWPVAERSLTWALSCMLGPSSTNLLPPSKERSPQTSVDHSQPSALCPLAPHASRVSLSARHWLGPAWESDGILAGPRFQGSQSSWENDPGAGARPRHRAQLDGENPGCGVVTGQPAVRMASNEGGNRQEPDPETPGQRLGTFLRREGPWEAFDWERHDQTCILQRPLWLHHGLWIGGDALWTWRSPMQPGVVGTERSRLIRGRIRGVFRLGA